MKNLILFILAISLLSSCDPTAVMDANIRNATSQGLSVQFFSSVGSDTTLVVGAYETVLFQEGFDIGATYLEPRLEDFDSVHIVNSSEDILKVFTRATPGKNIFNVKEDWLSSEPSKRVYRYDYEIEEEDLE